MARPPKDLKQPIPYMPGPPPADSSPPSEVIRAVWDELRKISEAMNNPPRP